MRMSQAQMYQRFLASDAGCDGRFFIGVLTTGIYCLPSCRARKPKAENIRFFPTCQAAREAGLRACKKCHPDDFGRGADPVREIVGALVAEVRAAPQNFPDARAIVRRSGFGATRLFELLRLHHHTTPAGLLTGARVAAARRLLLDDARKNTPLPDIAAAAGFKSQSAFHEHFRRLNGLTPSAWRESRASPPPGRRPVARAPFFKRPALMNHYYDTFTAPMVGVFSVALDDAGNVVATAFGDAGSLRERLGGGRHSAGELIRDPARARTARRQIEEYLAGARREFTLPLKPAGTPHQQRVWAALRAIPFGGTRSYGQLARTLRSSARAVGRANGANPIALIVPCHRVIGADGSLTGFAFGTNLKRKLLAHEGVEPWASELV